MCILLIGLLLALWGSAAMLGEAFHNTADSLDQVMLLIGYKHSERPPDNEHSFGYGKVRFSSNSQLLSRFSFHTVTLSYLLR